ncbi:hypothetical protein [Falsigemmobacter faecalis]|uniref:Uncharacterized protein n=1 Tax=Falsigemmobacter faecalis TaxID=2488730 RepID=A0A3P3DCF6_9RHOB|nr:hypothetical protein [Falsigemmobacter faecalis]RRH72013.1 hypothetical protein EG244_15985 [Falsigemmobacter faecalis]
MSDTVTIHNGHCSYHGPADKAPAWVIPAPMTSFEDTTHAWEEGYRAGRSDVQNLHNARLGYAQRIHQKLQRFAECADDSEGVDIGRGWLDALTTMGLIERSQRSPAQWALTEVGECALSAAPAVKQAAQSPAVQQALYLARDARPAGYALALKRIELLLAGIAQPAAPAVKVKPLVWDTDRFRTQWTVCGLYHYQKSQLSDRYCIKWAQWPLRDEGGATIWHDTIEAAKAAAQVDYEARILSALEGGDA